MTLCSFFGLLIMGSSFNMPCVARNFYFILTGMGKGCFNIFCGVLCFIDTDYWATTVVGIVMVSSGVLFIFLSRCRHMSDDSLQRAMSINQKALQKKAMEDSLNYAKNHKEEIAQAAIDNKEVIAQVAYDNRDAIAEVAYDNKELVAETYIRQQNQAAGNNY